MGFRVGLALLLCLSNSVDRFHEFYVSVTNIEIKEGRILGTTRLFVDDLELAIRNQKKSDWVLAEETMNDAICSQYLVSNISLSGDGVGEMEWHSRSIEGKGPTQTLVLRYSAQLAEQGPVLFRSTLLTEVYQDQVNMVHFKREQVRRSKNLNYVEASWVLR